MRARRSIAAGLLTAAACSTTVGGFAIIGSLDKAFAASPVSPPVSQPQNPGQSGQGQNPGQSGKGQNGQSQSLNSEVSGPFSGTTTLDFGSSNPNCTASFSSFQVFNTTYTTTTGTGSLSMDGCADLAAISDTNVSFNFFGTFVLTAPDGATLQGTATGAENGTFNPFSVATSLTLTPTSGTNEFANAAGVVNLTGTWLAGPVSLETDSPLSGSLSGALT